MFRVLSRACLELFRDQYFDADIAGIRLRFYTASLGWYPLTNTLMAERLWGLLANVCARLDDIRRLCLKVSGVYDNYT